MIVLTNSFHKTQAKVRANVGDAVSLKTYNRVRRALCGMEDCHCGNADGTRDSRYELVRRLHGMELERIALLVDNGD
jgi:hypothetical protein